MIPVLFLSSATSFASNGIGELTDAMSCKVTEELNGLYELEMTYPVEGELFSYIQIDAIIRAYPYVGATVPEPFRIYKITKPLNGIVTVYAQDLTYLLCHIPVMPITAASMTATQALATIKANAAESCPVDFYTNITASGNFGLETPASMRSVIGGIEGSFLDVYGGEITWQYPSVYINQTRGESRNFIISYGKNLTELLQDGDISSVITGICPFARYTHTEEVETTEIVDGEEQTTTETVSTEVILTLPERVIESAYASSFPFNRTVCVDLTEKFADHQGTDITEAELRAAANAYLASNASGVPKVSLQVSYVGIKDDVNGVNVNHVNDVRLGDTVIVNFLALGISTYERVRQTVYDVLKERYESVIIGSPVDDLAGTINDIQTGGGDSEVATKDYVNRMIKTVGGGAGAGNVVLNAAKAYADEVASAALNSANQATTTAIATAQAAGNSYADTQAAAAVTAANNATIAYIASKFETVDVEFQNVLIGNYWDTGGIYYMDIPRPAAIANKHIVSTMLVQTYGGSPMDVYPCSTNDTCDIRFTSMVEKNIHATVRFLIINS